ncbi:MAG: type IV pilin N-terminal domain-containing protein [Methanomicrobiales archaeon]|nr:type IV pilin N-terminal domain-containing protein [Methanomicrobiales archaeon]
MKNDMESAVSPVVGVMLMLVVTIIIAAVVSAFAGGLAGESRKAPQASLSVTPVIEGIQDTDKTDYTYEYPTGFTAKNGLLFEHKGGDGFALNDIAIQLQSQDAKYTITMADTINSSSTCLPGEITKYFGEIGSNDGFIAPGDRFMLYADNCYDSSDGMYGPPQGRAISWKPAGAEYGFAVFLNTKCEYAIIDKASQKVIQKGEFVLM